jgi:hypothetical protein
MAPGRPRPDARAWPGCEADARLGTARAAAGHEVPGTRRRCASVRQEVLEVCPAHGGGRGCGGTNVGREREASTESEALTGQMPPTSRWPPVAARSATVESEAPTGQTPPVPRWSPGDPLCLVAPIVPYLARSTVSLLPLRQPLSVLLVRPLAPSRVPSRLPGHPLCPAPPRECRAGAVYVCSSPCPFPPPLVLTQASGKK